jgi:penicillin-binding protein 1A
MNRVTGGSLPAAAWRSFMLATTKGMPVKPLPAPQPVPERSPVSPPAEESPLDRLFGWLGMAPGTPLPPPPINAGLPPGQTQ